MSELVFGRNYRQEDKKWLDKKVRKWRESPVRYLDRMAYIFFCVLIKKIKKKHTYAKINIPTMLDILTDLKYLTRYVSFANEAVISGKTEVVPPPDPLRHIREYAGILPCQPHGIGNVDYTNPSDWKKIDYAMVGLQDACDRLKRELGRIEESVCPTVGAELILFYADKYFDRLNEHLTKEIYQVCTKYHISELNHHPLLTTIKRKEPKDSGVYKGFRG
jgi:hypothetical protein